MSGLEARPWRRRRLVQWLLGEPLLCGLLLAFLLISLLDPGSWKQTLDWLDIPVLASLTGLLAVAQAVRSSGAVQRLARVLVVGMHSRQSVVAVLLVLSALLAMLLTNDVALFLIVPLTLALCERVHLPRARLVVFEAFAVNAGSALSPIGNPQNLLLWQHSGLSLWSFAGQMLVPVAIMFAVLAAMAWLAFPAGRTTARLQASEPAAVDRPLALVAVLLLAGVVALLETGHAAVAALVVLALLGLWRPRVVLRMDWALIATVALMFVLLGHLADWRVVAELLAWPDWHKASTVLLGGVALSQVISNVPATMALVDRVPDTMALAAAVNIGGAGFVLGSLANLIALRLEGSRRIWWVFHLWSMLYLTLVLVLAWWLMT